MKELVRAIKKSASGAVFDAITINTFNSLLIVVPESNIVIKVDELLSDLFTKILNNITSNNALSSLRDTLLPKLMSGEIDVSKVEL